MTPILFIGREITGKEIKEVAALTGLDFPNGTKSIGYYFQGSGIDDALSIKVSIPEGTKDEFLKNEIFQNGNNSKASIQIGRSRSWWKLDDLQDRIDGIHNFLKVGMLRVHWGKKKVIGSLIFLGCLP